MPPLFEDLSLSQKRRFAARRLAGASVNTGYFEQKKTADISDDLVEGWVFPRAAFNIAQCASQGGEGIVPRVGDEVPPSPEEHWPIEEAAGATAMATFTEYVLAMEPLVPLLTRALPLTDQPVKTRKTS